MIKKLIFLLVLCSTLIGCNSVNIYKENPDSTKIEVSLKSEKDKQLANEICDSTEENFEIVVDIREKDKGDSYTVFLTKENNYEQVVYLPDGNYKFDPGWTINNDSQIIINISDAVINRENKIDKILLTLREEGVKTTIDQAFPKKEILEADINSGKVQYRGNIYTLPSKELLKVITEGEEVGIYVPGRETKEYYNYVVYNPELKDMDVSECYIIGIHAGNERFIFPKGVQPNSTYKSIVEKVGSPIKMDGFAVIFPKGIELSETEMEINGTDDKTVYKLKVDTTGKNIIRNVYYEHR